MHAYTHIDAHIHIDKYTCTQADYAILFAVVSFLAAYTYIRTYIYTHTCKYTLTFTYTHTVGLSDPFRRREFVSRTYIHT
jgi:hypothetical protein